MIINEGLKCTSYVGRRGLPACSGSHVNRKKVVLTGILVSPVGR